MVKRLTSPATFQFPLRNDGAEPKVFVLRADAYPKPVPPACHPERARDHVWDRLAAHRYGNHPISEGWSVTFAPEAEHVLEPGQEVVVTVTIEAPGAVPTPCPVNVNAFADGVLMGGVTLYVHS